MVVISIALMDWNDMSHRIRTFCARGRRRQQDARLPLAGRALPDGRDHRGSADGGRMQCWHGPQHAWRNSLPR